MTKSTVDRASDYMDESARKASQFTSSAADAIEEGLDAAMDGLEAARRAAKNGRDVLEDFADDTARRVKRYPLQSVFISLAAGVILGFVVGLTTRGK